MKRRPLRIVLDPGGLDTLTLNQGQFRYVRDLLYGLRDLAPEVRFTVLGGCPDPSPGLKNLFNSDDNRWRYVYFPRPTGRGSMYREQLRLTLVLVAVNADLYHSLHTVMPICTPCPSLCTVYDVMFELFPEYAEATRSRTYRLFRWAARTRARRAICISQTTADDVRRLWRIPADRLDVVRLGAAHPDATGEEGPVSWLPTDGVLIVSPYNLEPRKNLASLAVAFGQILRKIPTARLVLYGRAACTEEREAAFDTILKESGVGEATIRTGFLTEGQLASLYRSATVFAFPSLYEGFGYPILEAMAAGACVVARDASAMAEVLGDSGVTVEHANAEELAMAILDLLRDDDLRASLGMSASERAKAFSIQNMVEGTLSSYEKALGKSLRVGKREVE